MLSCYVALINYVLMNTQNNYDLLASQKKPRERERVESIKHDLYKP
jgi:plasmid maintenance system antidote protein VapI